MSNISQFFGGKGTFLNLENSVQYTQSGTFTVPAGVTEMYVTATGSGTISNSIADDAAESAIYYWFEDPTGRYGAIQISNSTSGKTWPIGGHSNGVTFTIGNYTSSLSGVALAETYDRIWHWGSDNGKVFFSGMITPASTRADYPFCHFDIATLAFVNGPSSARGTGHYPASGGAIHGRHWCYDSVAGYYYYLGEDRYISRATGLTDSDTITAYDVDNAGLASLANTGAFIDIYNSRGFVVADHQFTSNATRTSAAIRYTTDDGETWAEPTFTGQTVAFDSRFKGAAFSDDRSVYYLHQFCEDNSGTDVIWKSTDGGANWTVVAEIAVQTHTSAIGDTVDHFRTIECNADGSVVAVAGDFEALGTASAGGMIVFYQSDGTFIFANDDDTTDYGDAQFMQRSVDGNYLYSSHGGTGNIAAHEFATGRYVQRCATTFEWGQDTAAASSTYLAPSGLFYGPCNTTTTSPQAIIGVAPGSADGGDTTVSGTGGTVTAGGGKPAYDWNSGGSSVAVGALGGTSFPIGPLNETASTDIRLSGASSLKFPGNVGTATGDMSAPGGYDQVTATEYKVNGAGTTFLSTGYLPGGGGELVFRQKLEVTPGETITITIPPKKGYCYPAIAILEY